MHSLYITGAWYDEANSCSSEFDNSLPIMDSSSSVLAFDENRAVECNNAKCWFWPFDLKSDARVGKESNCCREAWIDEVAGIWKVPKLRTDISTALCRAVLR